MFAVCMEYFSGRIGYVWILLIEDRKEEEEK